jgi:hypothetical protein
VHITLQNVCCSLQIVSISVAFESVIFHAPTGIPTTIRVNGHILIISKSYHKDDLLIQMLVYLHLDLYQRY